MRGFWPRATGVITALIVAYGFASASANPLTPFRYESQAQRHCPADVIVWLDLGKGIYYSKRQRRYGRGFYRKFYVPGGSSQQRLSPLVARAAIRIRPNELRHDPLLKAVAASGGPPEAIFSSRSGSRNSLNSFSMAVFSGNTSATSSLYRKRWHAGPFDRHKHAGPVRARIVIGRSSRRCSRTEYSATSGMTEGPPAPTVHLTSQNDLRVLLFDLDQGRPWASVDRL